MKVLFSSTSGYGHVIPMLQLARAFREAGHDVLWATAAQALPLVTAAGIEAVPVGAHGADEAALRGAVLARARGAAGCRACGIRVPSHVRRGADPADDRGPARHRPATGAPTCSSTSTRSWRRPSSAPSCGVPSVTHSFGTAVPVAILDDTRRAAGPLWREHGLEVPPYAGCFRAGYLDICPPSVQTMPVDHIPGVQPLRPVSEAAPTAPGARGRRSSTSPWAPSSNRPELLREVVAGVAALPVEVLVAVGPRVEPASLGEQPTHVQVEQWVDQAEVLGRCSAVVSHGGSGTFLGALARGRAPALPAAGGRPVPQRRGR